MNKQKSPDLITEILNSLKTEDEIYLSYFKEELWTIKEFAALMAGITPLKFDLLHDPKNLKMTYQDFDQYKRANKIFGRFVKDLKKISQEKTYFKEEGMSLTPWRYLKWVAMNQIPIVKRFRQALPLHLIEVFSEFRPIEQQLKISPRYHREHHKALYQKSALSVLKKSHKKMTRQEIYNDPHMEYVRRTFKDSNGKQVSYKKRTLVEVWLAEIDPKKRGRPQKSKKTS